jgi:SOS-response transcriptional repressor LexA
MDPNERFKTLVEEAEQHWGKWGVQKKIAGAMDASEGSVSAWRSSGFTGNQTQLDALSQILSREKASQKKYAQHEEAATSSGNGREDARAKELVRQAPLISWASAGTGREYLDQEGDAEWWPTACKDENCYALKVEGDSMEEKFTNGDIIFVAPNGTLINGRLIAAKSKEGKIYFKILNWSGDKNDNVKFVSINPAYPVEEKSWEELQFVHAVHSVLRVNRHDLGSGKKRIIYERR